MRRWLLNKAALAGVKLTPAARQTVNDMVRFTAAAEWPTACVIEVAPDIATELLAQQVIVKRDADGSRHASYELAARFIL